MARRPSGCRRTARVTAVGVIAAAGLLAPATPGFAAAPTISPGVLMTTQLDARTAAECTADFVFTGADATYLGFAAHCAGGTNEMGVSGCEEPTVPLGTAVTIGHGGGPPSGRLAYSSWHTRQQRGETDPALCTYNDFALVQLDPAVVGEVDPSVPVFGGPTGLDSDGAQRGEAVYTYQPNNGPPAAKQGTSVGDAGGGLTHRVVTDPPGNPGDSGSGYLDADGRAFGVLSTQFQDAQHSNGVTDLAQALAYADRYGGLGTVTLVPGTAPFHPS
jgi:hypothetical protein